MLVLLDTHILLWAAYSPENLSAKAREWITAQENTLLFSAASIWEVAIKSSLGREDFTADANLLRRGLSENGYSELPITAAHAAGVSGLPPIHQDPFDRILIAQARSEGVPLLTADSRILEYGSPALPV